ncbi:MAG: EthD family reductase [Anaerolineae bacterium]|nr:EthD family reductase [Anaerolineae bacterium]
MVKLVILFKNASKTPHFEQGYARNLALLRKMPGVWRIEESDVLGSPTSDPAYHLILEVYFKSFEDLDAALTSPEGVTAGKDLMTFTGAHVEVLFVAEGSVPKPKALKPENLQAFLDNHHIDAEIVFPGQPTPTVPAAAEALSAALDQVVTPDQIVKSVVFLVNNQPFLVYGCGTRRVDPRKLAVRLNVSRKQVKLANADQVLDLTGYEVGTVPPLGLKTPMPTYMDPAIKDYEIVYAGGGGIDALLKISSQELERVSHAEIESMLQDDEAETSQTDDSGQNAK